MVFRSKFGEFEQLIMMRFHQLFQLEDYLSAYNSQVREILIQLSWILIHFDFLSFDFDDFESNQLFRFLCPILHSLIRYWSVSVFWFCFEVQMYPDIPNLNVFACIWCIQTYSSVVSCLLFQLNSKVFQCLPKSSPVFQGLPRSNSIQIYPNVSECIRLYPVRGTIKAGVTLSFFCLEDQSHSRAW